MNGHVDKNYGMHQHTARWVTSQVLSDEEELNDVFNTENDYFFEENILRSQSNDSLESFGNPDPRLPNRADDPRINSRKTSNGTTVADKNSRDKGRGRNTESFDPKSTIVRPDMRVIIGPRDVDIYNKGMLKHDDVLIVPDFFCRENDWDIYYRLIDEMRYCQSQGVKNAEWISWHEGAHLISQNPTGSPTFNAIQSRISRYFGINNKKVGTRFNWYRDATDWKPFHHDSAAFNEQRAQNQNITVGVSFGATRELAFLNAKTGTKIYFPQTNGMMFSFGRDVNISWKHGINALSPEEQQRDPRGRISIVLWGLCPPQMVLEEPDSPAMLTDNTRGAGHSMHATSASSSGRTPSSSSSSSQAHSLGLSQSQVHAPSLVPPPALTRPHGQGHGQGQGQGQGPVQGPPAVPWGSGEGRDRETNKGRTAAVPLAGAGQKDSAYSELQLLLTKGQQGHGDGRADKRGGFGGRPSDRPQVRDRDSADRDRDADRGKTAVHSSPRDPAGPSQAAAAAGTGGAWRGSPREAEKKRGAHRVVMAVSASADDEPLSAALTLSPPPHPLPLPLSDSGPEAGSGQVSASSHSEQEDGDSSAVKEAERYGLQVIGPDDLDPDLGPTPAPAPDPASPYSQRSQQNSARGRRQPRPAARLS